MYERLFSCQGKVAVVTGGCGLIGREIARALSEHGAKVYCADTVHRGEGRGGTVRHIGLDISSEESVEKALTSVMEEEGRIDILVNSAYPRTRDWGARLEKIPFSSWKANMDSHLGGYFLCSRFAAERMKAGGGGAIINIASIYGTVAPDFSIYDGTEMTMPAAYSAIKAGVIAFTKYLSTYYGKDNVRANTVSPGGVFDGQPASFVERYSRKTPLARMCRAEEIAGAIVFLASDASSYVTGHDLVVDGGWTAW